MKNEHALHSDVSKSRGRTVLVAQTARRALTARCSALNFDWQMDFVMRGWDTRNTRRSYLYKISQGGPHLRAIAATVLAEKRLSLRGEGRI